MVIKRFFVLFFLPAFFFHHAARTQSLADSIPEAETAAILQFLASDSMKGRGQGRPEQRQVARFIRDEFEKYGLKPMQCTPGFFHPFSVALRPRDKEADELTWNGKKLDPLDYYFFNPDPGYYAPMQLNDFSVVPPDSLITATNEKTLVSQDKDLLIWTSRPPDGGWVKWLNNLFEREPVKIRVLLVYALQPPDSILLTGNRNHYASLGYNVAGIIPGKSRPEEIILYSAHYDHVGVHYRGRKRDSIFNGANDNATGTTALLMLARYFSLRADNERTLLFCAFAGEEMGLLGSADFVKKIDTESILAGINIEMIGLPQAGEKTVFITGAVHSDLPAILEKQFRKTAVRVRAGPSEDKELFKRSDNFSFVEKGVPAHSIMSSDDDDKCYHRPCDEISRIDISHMTEVIRAIALASETLINGEDTPARIPAMK